MNRTLPRFLGAFAWLAFAGGLQAHPGHDGHELTWDATHGWTTFLPLLILVAALSLRAWQLQRR